MPQWIINSLLIIGALLISALLNAIDSNLSFAFGALLGISCAIWAQYDAKKIKLEQYKNPAIFVNANILSAWIFIVWIVFFPLYLSHRRKILEGKVPLKQTVKQ